MRLTALFILINSAIYCQSVFYQDVFRGNVCVVGLSSWDTTNIVLQNHGATNIRKAFLVSGRQIDDVIPGMDYPLRITINNNDFYLNNSTRKSIKFPSEYLQYNGSVHVVDVSNAITSASFQTNVHINEYYQSIPPGENDAFRYYGMSLVVLYNDLSKNPVNFSIWLNNKNLNYSSINHTYSNLMPINILNDVGVSVSTGHLVSTNSAIQDGSFVWLNNDSIGLIGESSEWNVSSAGTILGQFSYENGNLHGIGDDSNSPFMNETDALINIRSYIQNNATSFNLTFRYQKPNATPFESSSNPIWATYITYTTPCQPFDVTVPNDTTVCYGSQVQLNATGGSSTGSLPAYEWSPATGLSCTTCPNPIFTADSSMFYTVRIRNNDSCSVVRPVKINVRPIPSINAISTVATECGSSTGSLTAVGIAMRDLYVVTENGDTLSATSQNQLNATVSNLGAGNYAVFYTDTNGCVSLDTVVTISSINNTIADFTVTPISGGAPLTVNVNNGSQNATDFEWFTSTGLSHQGTVPPAYVFDSSGTYQIMLVAWKNDPACADTAYASVWVYDSLIVHIPNVFTANGDGINDFFSITVNQPVKAKLQIVNRWGNEVFSFDGMLNVGATNLWNGTSAGEVTEGVYFYTLTVDLMTNDLIPPPVSPSEGGVENHSLKKEGFVTVIGD